MELRYRSVTAPEPIYCNDMKQGELMLVRSELNPSPENYFVIMRASPKYSVHYFVVVAGMDSPFNVGDACGVHLEVKGHLLENAEIVADRPH